jgi:hypothetical protein
MGVDHSLTHLSFVADLLLKSIAFFIAVFVHTRVALLSLLNYWWRIRAEAPQRAQGESDHVDSFHRTLVTRFRLDIQALE